MNLFCIGNKKGMMVNAVSIAGVSSVIGLIVIAQRKSHVGPVGD